MYNFLVQLRKKIFSPNKPVKSHIDLFLEWSNLHFSQNTVCTWEDKDFSSAHVIF